MARFFLLILLVFSISMESHSQEFIQSEVEIILDINPRGTYLTISEHDEADPPTILNFNLSQYGYPDRLIRPGDILLL
jgi:hypothetical protein